MTRYKFLILVSALVFAFMLPGRICAEGGGSFNRPADPDFAQANTAIQEKDWDKAIALLNASLARNEKNADAHNLLGYSERMRGNLDAAFRHYERALELDPKHRGAHEYVGEAYLMADNLPKAEEHLARLDELCFFSCKEYRDLNAAVAEYKQKRAN